MSPQQSVKMIGAQFRRFIVVGGLTSIVYFATLITLVDVLKMTRGLSAAISFLLAVAFNFACHRNWTFQSRHIYRASLPRYAVVVGGGMLINALVLEYLPPVIGVNYLLVQIGFIAALVISNFLLFRWWVFDRS